MALAKSTMALLLLLANSSIAFGQQNIGAAPLIAGVQVNCGRIPAIVVANLPDIGMARPGVILLHPNFFRLPANVQLFIYGHECAHHQPGIGSDEVLADRWAIKVGKGTGVFRSIDAINDICAYFANNPGDMTHPPGRVRCANMRRDFASQ